MKEPGMRLLQLGLAGLVVFLLAAGAPKPKDLIVGKWTSKQKIMDKEIEATVEFTKDGGLKMSFGGINLDGQYKFLDDDNIEMEMTFNGQTKKQKIKVEVTKDKLTTTSEKGMKDEFTRAK
jgi:uncharacterized protein (TIGR03066 family)